MPSAISIQQLKKTYQTPKGKSKDALLGIDLEVEEGSFFGLLGPNGAGKSTLINIMAGLVLKTSGQVSICGYDIVQEERKAKQSIGIVPQELVLDPFFTPRQVLENTAGYYGLRKKDRRTDAILQAVGLLDKAGSPARSLSGGMRRRLLVAKAMVHNPKVLVLDEPTAGVDVSLREQLWQYVKQLNKQGTTILLTTHYLEEAEELCDQIAVINHGQIIANENKKTLMKTIDRKALIISPSTPLMQVPSSLNSDVLSSTLNPHGQLEISYRPKHVSVHDIMTLVLSTGITIADISTQEPDLEDVFRHLTA